ncbi:MAG: SDR family oxidoreductase [Alphaproteobacteria bacterium]|nr:SDR family oxidoreductase [Alphaproteobacteria bacterium]
MIAVTGATGKLGTHVLSLLLERVPAAQIRAVVRTPSKAAAWSARGVEVVAADYDDPERLEAAFRGADKVLLISSSAVGQRARQHRAAIDAATRAGVPLLVYTSMLHADTSHTLLAEEHRATEAALKEAPLSTIVLRNGWYVENYTENLGANLGMGLFPGAAKDGRIAAATREDLAAAAVAVLTEEGHAGHTYELAGPSFTMTELARTVSEVAGRSLPYVDMEEAAYRAALVEAGVPAGMAHVLADADAAIARGELDAPSDDLVGLIGRAPTPLRAVVEARLGHG